MTTIKHTTRRMRGWLILLSFFWLAGSAESAFAHATPIQTIPAANATIEQAPTEVTITFNEAVVPGLSTVTVLSQSGKPIAVESIAFAADDTAVTAALPPLDNAAYLVSWNVVSAVDGHNTTGTFSFGVGVDALSTAQKVTFWDGVLWSSSVARTLRVVGMALLIGVFAFQLFVTRIEKNGRALAWCAVVLIIAGLLVTLVNQIAQFGTASVDTWLATTFGRLWMLQIVVLGLLIPGVDSLKKTPNRVVLAACFVGAIGLATFNALSSHSAALSSVAVRGTLIDLVHVTTAGMWAGGLVLLVGAWRGATDAWRTTNFTRFSTMAAMAMGTLFLSGGWLGGQHVGNWNALVGTTYGLLLLLKMGLLVPVLGMGAYNLLVVGRRLKQQATPTPLPTRLLMIEAILAVMIVVAAGFVSDAQRAISAPLLTAEAGQTTLNSTADNLNVTVAIEPALVGNNTFNLIITDAADNRLTDAETVSVRFTYLDQSLGDNSGTAVHRGNGVYTMDGSFISLSGQWQMEVKVVRAGVYDTFVPYRLEAGIGGDIRALDARVSVLEQSGRFLTLTDKAGTGTLMIVLALVWALIATRATHRVWQTAPMLIACAAVMWLGSTQLIDYFTYEYTPGKFATNPILPDSASIAQGQTVFEEYCVQCHGINGAGDGVLARSLIVSPANFADGHTEIHTDGDLFYWIANGKNNGVMPPWGSTLADDDMWHLVNYVRRLAITGQAVARP